MPAMFVRCDTSNRLKSVQLMHSIFYQSQAVKEPLMLSAAGVHVPLCKSGSLDSFRLKCGGGGKPWLLEWVCLADQTLEQDPSHVTLTSLPVNKPAQHGEDLDCNVQAPLGKTLTAAPGAVGVPAQQDPTELAIGPRPLQGSSTSAYLVECASDCDRRKTTCRELNQATIEPHRNVDRQELLGQRSPHPEQQASPSPAADSIRRSSTSSHDSCCNCLPSGNRLSVWAAAEVLQVRPTAEASFCTTEANR
ncbi:hypothetical protein ABBQ32_013477 [Trebouxia sp. C0010 RCD-2024]